MAPDRRRCLGWIPALLVLPIALPARAGGRLRVLVQASPLAGSQYHEFPAQGEAMAVGDALTLVREPDNPHDPLAVKVLWRGHHLGYLPRAENSAVAEAMDQGLRVEGRIARLRPDASPWQRLEIQVFVTF